MEQHANEAGAAHCHGQIHKDRGERHTGFHQEEKQNYAKNEGANACDKALLCGIFSDIRCHNYQPFGLNYFPRFAQAHHALRGETAWEYKRNEVGTHCLGPSLVPFLDVT
ncbi:MAG: hypothetical protein RR350_05950 [Oscillibacter sp.]